jgi:hypothetical protein
VAKLPHPLEAEILRQCLDYLALQPDFFTWRNNTGAFRIPNALGGKTRFVRAGLVGSSDILGVMAPRGRLVAIEIKRPGNNPTEAQYTFLELVNRLGGLSCVVRSLDDLIARVNDWRSLP